MMTELETMQRAKMYLDKLARGIDPISGREIPNDSELNNVRLARLSVREIGEGRAFSGGVLRGKRTAVYSGPSDGHPAGRTIAQ